MPNDLSFEALCSRYPELQRAHLKEVELRKRYDVVAEIAHKVSFDDPSYASRHAKRRQAWLDVERQRGFVVGLTWKLRDQERAHLVTST